MADKLTREQQSARDLENVRETQRVKARMGVKHAGGRKVRDYGPKTDRPKGAIARRAYQKYKNLKEGRNMFKSGDVGGEGPKGGGTQGRR